MCKETGLELVKLLAERYEEVKRIRESLSKETDKNEYRQRAGEMIGLDSASRIIRDAVGISFEEYIAATEHI
ncbi:hypothetical protein ABH897_003436 [Paenibacillus sp. RC73]|uniref:Uncharacterized protein n=1 Tax=Paenibacillus terrae TaxID=159743 RepID=A0A4U2PYM5_9BACL|nr:hypothetical protein [Paenibacillus terrae]TKH43416.1 hypothetical protein C1I60_14050 [Paenibacillus terrae]